MLNRKLGRNTAHRNAMLRGLTTYLLENGSVETTLTRAKEVRSVAEKMITLGKKNTLASRRAALGYNVFLRDVSKCITVSGERALLTQSDHLVCLSRELLCSGVSGFNLAVFKKNGYHTSEHGLALCSSSAEFSHGYILLFLILQLSSGQDPRNEASELLPQATYDPGYEP